MTVSRRSILEVRMAILECFTKKTIITKVMYKANVNCTEINKIIKVLLKIGFITKERVELKGGRKNIKLSKTPKQGRSFLYELTEEGLRFLKIWNQFKKEYEKIRWNLRKETKK